MVRKKEVKKASEILDNMLVSGYPIKVIRHSKEYKIFRRYIQERKK